MNSEQIRFRENLTERTAFLLLLDDTDDDDAEDDDDDDDDAEVDVNAESYFW
jgi:hypothetical protein